MKLYYSPGACSLAVHIALRKPACRFELVAAPTRTHQLADGTDYHTINPLGLRALLELADGTRLTEVPAPLQYVADQARRAPRRRPTARWRATSCNRAWHRLDRAARPLGPPVQPDHARRGQGRRGPASPNGSPGSTPNWPTAPALAAATTAWPTSTRSW